MDRMADTELQRQLFARSERVKGIDFHPQEPWILTTLYSGMPRHIQTPLVTKLNSL